MVDRNIIAVRYDRICSMPSKDVARYDRVCFSRMIRRRINVIVGFEAGSACPAAGSPHHKPRPRTRFISLTDAAHD
jgi:hypothetical protein